MRLVIAFMLYFGSEQTTWKGASPLFGGKLVFLFIIGKGIVS